MHHPFYSTTMPENASGECIAPVRQHYEALFRKYDVRLVFSGHAHLWEHFHVPDNGQATKADPHPASYVGDGNSIHYVVTGGGGGPLNSCPSPKKELSLSFWQGRFCAFHVTQVKVDGKKLTVSAIKVTGSASSYKTEVADSFAIVSP
jgi:ubiquitin